MPHLIRNKPLLLMVYYLCVTFFIIIGVVNAQFFGTNFQQPQQQQQFSQQSDRNNVPQLSFQQQDQILSDIQQHQHRFGLQQQQQQQRTINGVPQPQLFIQRHQQLLAHTGLYGNQQQQPFNTQNVQKTESSLPQSVFQQQPIINSNNVQTPTIIQPGQHQQLVSTAQTQLPSDLSSNRNSAPNFNQFVTEQQKNSILFPSVPPSIGTPSGSVVQHHTQTSFLPNYVNQVTQRNQFLNTRPTTDPIEIINKQIKLLHPENDKQRIKELEDKKAIIEKHNQFVQKQYEKALKKVQDEHREFVDSQKEQRKKLYENLAKSNDEYDNYRTSQSAPRYIFPNEKPLFEKALKQYYIEHPTTTTTTTTTTTAAPSTTKAALKKRNQNKPSFLPTILPTTVAQPASSSVKIQSLTDLDILKQQYKNQQINKDDLRARIKAAIGATVNDDDLLKNLSLKEVALANGKKVQLIEDLDPKLFPQGKEEEITLPNGDKAIAIRADPSFLSKSNKLFGAGDKVTLPTGQKLQILGSNKDSNEETAQSESQKSEIFKTSSSSAAVSYKTQEITLPNGQKAEIVRTTDPKLVPGGVRIEPGSDLEKLVFAETTTVKPAKVIFDEITKNVVPPGTDYELLKTGASGSLENIETPNNIPNQKKVAFVLLEEQSDGTLKLQGIKGNGKEKPDVDVESILKKLKAGEIKLPSTTTTTVKPKETTAFISTTLTPSTTTTTSSPSPRTISVTVTPNSFATHEISRLSSTTTKSSALPVLSTNIGSQFYSTFLPSTGIYSSSSGAHSPTTRSTTPNSLYSNDFSKLYSVTPDQTRQASSISTSNRNLITVLPISTTSSVPSSTTTTTTTTQKTTEYVVKSHSKPTTEEPKELSDLTVILKDNGLYAMARFLKQSGLDAVLNDTGPYTIFAPTDKAFRNLLVQLGGPERAEEKFKENPRLLSGLLLHHVIPGAFPISSLQDEMTGVSLAGTQLRVNQYDMHDREWNNVKVTTINGARVTEEHQNIPISQGVAHSVDKVMFPLPVGDLIQTMQADREKRFASFLRAIYSAGLTETLQGPKSLTLFAPTDKAFAALNAEDFEKTVTDPILAKELVLRHIIQGALYTSGMRYYQEKDTLKNDIHVVISKHSGKIKVNDENLVSPNIPATNGVIHAIDALL